MFFYFIIHEKTTKITEHVFGLIRWKLKHGDKINNMAEDPRGNVSYVPKISWHSAPGFSTFSEVYKLKVKKISKSVPNTKNHI